MAGEKALQELGKGREWQQSKETNYLSVIHVTLIVITLHSDSRLSSRKYDFLTLLFQLS